MLATGDDQGVIKVGMIYYCYYLGCDTLPYNLIRNNFRSGIIENQMQLWNIKNMKILLQIWHIEQTKKH